jgi:hypothetical protein
MASWMPPPVPHPTLCRVKPATLSEGFVSVAGASVRLTEGGSAWVAWVSLHVLANRARGNLDRHANYTVVGFIEDSAASIIASRPRG